MLPPNRANPSVGVLKRVGPGFQPAAGLLPGVWSLDIQAHGKSKTCST
jgi:hypothetical protein